MAILEKRKVSIDAIMRAPNRDRVLNLIREGEIGDRVRIMCSDTSNGGSYAVVGKLKKFEKVGLIVCDKYVPYKSIEFYEIN